MCGFLRGVGSAETTEQRYIIAAVARRRANQQWLPVCAHCGAELPPGRRCCHIAGFRAAIVWVVRRSAVDQLLLTGGSN